LINFRDYVMVCNSTGNQPVNLIPALQFGITQIVTISTEQALKQRWTEKLQLVAKNYSIIVSDLAVPSRLEKSLPDLTNLILSSINNHSKIAWNISGGQKIPTIALHEVFRERIRCGHSGDVVVYTEGKPPTIWFHDSNYLVSSIKSNVFLSLEDVLMLYGSRKTQGEMLYPHLSKKIEICLETGSKALQYFVDDKLFREAFFALMRPSEDSARSIAEVKELARKILEGNKPAFQTLSIEHNEGYKRLEKEIGNVFKEIDNSSSLADLKKRIKHLRSINQPKQIFDNYWQSIKSKTIEQVINALTISRHELLTNTISEEKTSRLVSQICSLGGIVDNFSGQICKEDVHKFSGITPRPGVLFEWMIAALIMELIKTNEVVKNNISEIHINVGTQRSDDPEAKQDSEFDLVITTRFGTLILFEMKTHDFSGDVAKGKEGAAYKKSGPFGKAVIIGPIMNDMIHINVRKEKEYDHYIDRKTQDQEKTASQNNIQYWYLDDVKGKLMKELS